MPWSRNAYATALDLRSANSLEYKIRWGGISDLLKTVGTAELENVRCRVVQKKIDQFPTHDASGNGLPVPMLRELKEQNYPVAGELKGWDFHENRKTGLLLRSHTVIALRDRIERSDMVKGDCRVVSASRSFREHGVAVLTSDYLTTTGVSAPLGVYPIPYEMEGDAEFQIYTNDLDSDLVVSMDIYATSTLDSEIRVIREALRYSTI